MPAAVPFPRKAPPLTEIAASLRDLAAKVEAGDVSARTMVLIWPDADLIVAGAAYGELPDRFGLAGLLHAAAHKATSGAW